MGMGLMVVLVGSVPSLGSLLSSGSLRAAAATATSTSSEHVSYSSFWRVSLPKRVLKRDKRWHLVSTSVCKCSFTTTDIIFEQSNAVPLDSNSAIKGSNDDANIEIALKPAPRPVLKSPLSSKGESLPGMNSVGWEPSRGNGDSDHKKVDDDGGGDDERNKVIELLGEVLQKAERLETSKSSDMERTNITSRRTDNRTVNKLAASNISTNSRTGKLVNSTATPKTASFNNVWRKGDTVKPSTNLSQPQPKVRAKPSIAPPPTTKRPIILKNVGAIPKSLIMDETDLGSVKQPILIDKFARKEPVVDPPASLAVSAPTRPRKGPAPGKLKDSKKCVSPEGQRMRIVDDAEEVEIPVEDALKLNVSIPGAATGRKGRKWSKASRKAARLQAAKVADPVKAEILEVGEKGMLIDELAYNLATSEGEILGYLYSKRIKLDGVQTLGQDIVKMICKEYEVEVIDADPVKLEELAKKKEILDEDDLDKLQGRPPVLTIMGHVDHGKTTLLDFIRKSKVAAAEAGGITQGIGAYKVMVPVDGKLQPCVFLDTPGHAAFGAMRARGARVTDIVIIVVAADDGIGPQTNEAIAHAKAARVPIVIAINKIDKEGANPERVMQELSSAGLMPEDWGGDTPTVQISALQGNNIEDLLETVMLVAELQELKANPHRNAIGTVIEAGLHKSKGPVATFIIQNGTLKKGDIVVCGEAFGKVRALYDDGGNRVDKAGPSIPVQVIGLTRVPIAGDEFEVVASLDIARERAETCAESLQNELISAKAGDRMVTLSSLASAVSAGKLSGIDLHQLNIIMKVDVQGSIEAVRQALQVLPQDNVTLKFLLQATGDLSISDVDLAVASEAIILGFNVKAPSSVKNHAERKGIEIRLYKVIYELIDDVRNAMEGLLDPVEEEETIGSAEVRAVFSSGSGRVAGCMVIEGKVVKDCGLKVIRKGKIVHVGVLTSLRRVREIVREVNAGLECGIGVEGYTEWEEGDIIKPFQMVQRKLTLEEATTSMAVAVEKAGIHL